MLLWSRLFQQEVEAVKPPSIELMDMASVLLQPQGEDMVCISWYIHNLLSKHQETFSVIEKCPKPVIAAIHGGCIGAGVDLITACDIRYCAKDAFFQVKEVDMGVASDVGTLQRLPRVIGSQILVNELAFTARKLMADEARSSGLVSRVFPDKEVLFDAAFSLAAEISSKSPVAVQGTKVNLLYARDHPVADSLNFVVSVSFRPITVRLPFQCSQSELSSLLYAVCSDWWAIGYPPIFIGPTLIFPASSVAVTLFLPRNWNMSMLQTDDIVKSVQAAMEKKELKSVTFSKL
ncbi:delta(3,5)-Delta(2,4)-dienoyl-CoA isomerase, mitochondrial [Trichechus manatus latirostris]|uniref:Delta(3,5)-Delta(2,4)-dienoyl-CoA isomerase, mitochondrial n=1 Tax=Trichechus manatus latirostris TaxID=127582 RepID=A0A2Y9S1X0_TRIMA|nr:delta(3,5)-Delta(2,4)-dienoyl-CoA isomerase, mitochondrial [Trichechus manatus latirostris]